MDNHRKSAEQDRTNSKNRDPDKEREHDNHKVKPEDETGLPKGQPHQRDLDEFLDKDENNKS